MTYTSPTIKIEELMKKDVLCTSLTNQMGGENANALYDLIKSAQEDITNLFKF